MMATDPLKIFRTPSGCVHIYSIRKLSIRSHLKPNVGNSRTQDVDNSLKNDWEETQVPCFFRAQNCDDKNSIENDTNRAPKNPDSFNRSQYRKVLFGFEFFGFVISFVLVLFLEEFELVCKIRPLCRTI